jgi:hypothetical protein
MWKRVLPLSLLVLGVGVFVGSAGVRADDRDKGSRGTGLGVFEGRIMSVNATKHHLVLGDAHLAPVTGTKGTGTGDRGTGDRGTGDRTGDRGTGTGAGARGTSMTFLLAENARVTLDGKQAELSDLKSGMRARVHTARGAGDKSTTGTGDRTGDRTSERTTGDRTGAGAGRAMTADRIEAISSGAGTGTRGTGTERRND